MVFELEPGLLVMLCFGLVLGLMLELNQLFRFGFGLAWLVRGLGLMQERRVGLWSLRLVEIFGWDFWLGLALYC